MASAEVLTIAAAKGAGYYESPEFARDDSYGEDGHALGRWVGREATPPGLAGAPERGHLETLLSGHHPGDGARLGGRFRTLNAGFDVTFTAPKSVSVLAAVADPVVREAAVAAHEAGVAAGLDYLERFECRARRGANGLRLIAPAALSVRRSRMNCPGQVTRTSTRMWWSRTWSGVWMGGIRRRIWRPVY